MESEDWLIGFTIDFSHSEKVSIPAELFVGEKGLIIFDAQVYIQLFQYPENNEKSEVGTISLFYKIAEGKVILSATEF